MKGGVSMATIAEALGIDRSAVVKRAKSEHWLHTTERTQGGRRHLYPIGALPSDVRAKVEIAAAKLALAAISTPAPANDDPVTEAAAASADSATAWAWFDRQPDSTKAEARRKAEALDAVATLVGQGLGLTAARDSVAAAIGDSPRTLIRWGARVKGIPRADWLPALADQYAGGTRTAECTPAAWKAFKADYLRQEQPTAASCYGRLRRAAAAEGWTIPSLKTLERRIEAEVPQAVRTLLRQGPEALKRSYPHQTRDRSVFTAMQAVNADGHKFDVFCRWPDGTVGRPVMVAFQDLYSGKILSWRIGRSECQEAVRLTIRDMVATWGIPEQCWLDNGRNFASKWITGGTATRYRFKVRDDEPDGALTLLGVQVHWTTPYWGQAKPIERAFRDLCDTVAKHPVCAGAWTGNNPLAKPENYGSKAIPIADFIAMANQEIAHHNARPGRRAATAAGRSLDETFAESYARSVVRRATEEQLRQMLLAGEGLRLDAKSGALTLFGNRYWTEALGAHAGRKVVVRFDPETLAAPVPVYTLDGRFLATADRIEAAGFDDVAAAKSHARARGDYLRATRQAADAQVRLDALDPVARVTPLEPAAPPKPGVTRLHTPPRRGKAAPVDANTTNTASDTVTDLLTAGLARLRSA